MKLSALLLLLSITSMPAAGNQHRSLTPHSSVQLVLDQGCVNEEPPDTCSTSSYGSCKPYRSPDACPLQTSFPLLIQRRTTAYRSHAEQVEEEGFWFHYLGDKLAQYMFTNGEGYRAPQIYYCTSDGGLEDWDVPNDGTIGGFVVRATNLHSSNGIFVLPNGFGGMELLRGKIMTMDLIKADLELQGATDVIVEEYIRGYDVSGQTLPTEYKFHMFNGVVGSINVASNRGTDCACWAEMDSDWNRLDGHGCFVPSESTDSVGTCPVAIDFVTGSQHAYPVKGLNLCNEVEKPEDCLLVDMLNIAKELSLKIGVYVRVDMFISNAGEIIVQEYTINHMNGLRHCSAKSDDDGCINPCFLGELWQETSVGNNPLFGGPLTEIPVGIHAWQDASDVCLAATEVAVASNAYESTCTISTSPPLVNITSTPSSQLSSQPSMSSIPSEIPSSVPSISSMPSSIPSFTPSLSVVPSALPSLAPSISSIPSGLPSSLPTSSAIPSSIPSISPSQSSFPSTEPSYYPSAVHSELPSLEPSAKPSTVPSGVPSGVPSTVPSADPSNQPSTSSLPSVFPSNSPSASSIPSTLPSSLPSQSPIPSEVPSDIPTTSALPSSVPSLSPSSSSFPSIEPSQLPSSEPTVEASDLPSINPSSLPSDKPSKFPSGVPSLWPSGLPSGEPSIGPSADPSDVPSLLPSGKPSIMASDAPSKVPTSTPSSVPSHDPSWSPSEMPSGDPSAKPSENPSVEPSSNPSSSPTSTPSWMPSNSPSGEPSEMPSGEPSAEPSDGPSSLPSMGPSDKPTREPSMLPTATPSAVPSTVPSQVPSHQPSNSPSDEPSDVPSSSPSVAPSDSPSDQPSHAPTTVPSLEPSNHPSLTPTLVPSELPSFQPSQLPSETPSLSPSLVPTTLPSTYPSSLPSLRPSGAPSDKPSVMPSTLPSSSPSLRPSSSPSSLPSTTPTALPSSPPSAASSLSPSYVPVALIEDPPPEPCADVCPIVDFETLVDGTNLTRGDYVAEEWRQDYGLTIYVEANGDLGYTPANANGYNQARIFDSRQPGTNNDNGDPDLGSPNKECGGLGVGSGGEPGEVGENCGSGVGNLLIIQEGDKSDPDDLAKGGKINFVFDTPVSFASVQLMDIDEPACDIEVLLSNGTLAIVTYEGVGNNGIQTVNIGYDGVVQVTVVLPGSGAVVDVRFCVPDAPCSTTSYEDECGRCDDAENHGEWVSCVAHYADDLAAAGIIANNEKSSYVTEAAHSSCGMPNRRQLLRRSFSLF